jgi:hypothetical protein
VLQVSDTRKLFLVLAGALAVAFMVNALTASPASAGIIPNPIDAVKGLIGVPGDVAGELGATVLKEALEWLLGGIKTAITLALVKFLTHIELPVGRSLAQVTGPMIVIGGFFLVTGLITSIGDGYREIVAGTDTPPRVIGQAIFRVIGLALLLGAWYWIVPLAVDVANGMSDYVRWQRDTPCLLPVCGDGSLLGSASAATPIPLGHGAAAGDGGVVPVTTRWLGRTYASPAMWGEEFKARHSIAGRAMAGGSRPASNQPAARAAHGIPTTMRER